MNIEAMRGAEEIWSEWHVDHEYVDDENMAYHLDDKDVPFYDSMLVGYTCLRPSNSKNANQTFSGHTIDRRI